MEMPKPTPAHDKLRKLIGRWKGPETMSPSPWDPKGGTAVGTAENKPALDGFAVIQDYIQLRENNVTFRGHGVFAYDTNENCYTIHWFDSMGTPGNLYKGNFEGDVLKLSSKFQTGFSRVSWDLSKEGEHTFKMEMSPDGKMWQPMMVGTYKKEK